MTPAEQPSYRPDASFDGGLDCWGGLLPIRRHIDRQTGELKDCFVPRYAAREIAD